MRKKSTQRILIFLALLIAGSYGFYKYLNKPHRDIASEKAEFELKTSELVDYMANDEKAKLFIDKVVETSGAISSIEKDAVILDDKIQVNLNPEFINTITVGQKITVKGRCVGYDDLLEIVKVDQATILNN